MWDMLWDAGKESSRTVQGVIGSLREETKVKKGNDQGALEGGGKNRRIRG